VDHSSRSGDSLWSEINGATVAGARFMSGGEQLGWALKSMLISRER